MSASPVRRDGYPAGVALYGTMFAIGLMVVLPLAIVLFTLPLGKDAPPGFISTGVAAVVAAVAYCVMAATAISLIRHDRYRSRRSTDC